MLQICSAFQKGEWMMDKKLFLQAVLKFLGGLILVALPLFLSAGTLSFYQAWILIGVLFAPMFAAGIILTFKKPELLKKRLNTKEDQDE